MELTDVQNFYSTNPADYKNISYEMVSSAKTTFSTGEREIDGIEILYNMAKSGKIDPWDIDLTNLADKYLLEIANLKSENLKHTGRTILFLSVLLKMKSNVLEGIDLEELFPDDEVQSDDFEPDYDGFEDIEEPAINRNNIISIDEVLVRRTSVKQNRNRVVTLRDIIRQLEFYEKLDRKQELKNSLERQRKRVSRYSRLSSRDIVSMYNEDFIKSAIPKLKENLDRIFEKETEIELETLTLLGFEKTTAYLAMLFLVANTEYDIKQEKFYDKLYVKKGEMPKLVDFVDDKVQAV